MTATAVPSIASRTWTEPDGIRVRGTVIVLVGRGETPEVYERLGRRIAADAYRVIALDEADGAARTAAELLADDAVPGPKVLLGSDIGADVALEVAARNHQRVAGLVLAGLPTVHDGRNGDFDNELEARTACPAHRAVLAQTARGGLFAAATTRPVLALESLRPAGVPTLAVHGSADTISPADVAIERYRAAGAHQIVLVSDGRHDILNDVTHRTVAATIVLFLERLRLGGDLPVIAREVTPSGSALAT